MTTLLALVPGFLALIYVFWAGEEKAFRNIYLPVLFLTPQIYSAEIKGFPDLTFQASAIIPIAIYTGCKYFLWWRWSMMDFFIVLFILACIISEYIAVGDMPQEGNLTIALLAELIFYVFFPYILGKAIIYPKGKSVDYAKRIVALTVFAVIISLYEMRLVANPFVAIFRPFFPGQGDDWPTLFRMGLVRVGGPFIQSILFGLAIAVALVFDYWITKANKLGLGWRKWIPIPFSQGWVYAGILTFGLLMTLSRGPLFSVIVGLLIASVGFTPQRLYAVVWRAVVLFIGGIFAVVLYQSYSEMSTTLSDDLAATAAYRAKLWEHYSNAVMERFTWGWGFNTWPHDQSLQSIDNEYLFLMIKHGFVGLACFLLSMGWIMGRLFWRGMMLPSTEKDSISLCFTLLGVLFTLMSAIVTVFLGLQIRPLFYVVVGWAEGFLLLTKIKRQRVQRQMINR